MQPGVGLDGREGVEGGEEGGGIATVGGFDVGDPAHEEVSESFGGGGGGADFEELLRDV